MIASRIVAASQNASNKLVTKINEKPSQLPIIGKLRGYSTQLIAGIISTAKIPFSFLIPTVLYKLPHFLIRPR